MFGLAFLPLALFLSVASLVVFGALLSPQVLASRYFALVQDDVDASFSELSQSNSPTDTSLADSSPSQVADAETESLSVADPEAISEASTASEGSDSQTRTALSRAEDRRVQVPLRRILQLGNFNPRVAYVVASQMARQGRLGMAARMMRDIAPLGKGGFAYAHAWLAEYSMQAWKDTDSEAETLLADLQAAERGGATLTSVQVRNCASLLVRFKRPQDAIVLLRDYARRYYELNVLLANLYKETGHMGVEYHAALQAGRDGFQAKRKLGALTTQDWFVAVQIEMLDDKLDQALRIAGEAYKSEPNSSEIARLCSNMLLAKHRELMAREQEKIAAAAPFAATAGSAASSVSAEGEVKEAVESDKSSSPPTPVVASTALPNFSYLEAACRIDSANPALAPEVAKVAAMGTTLSEALQQALERSLADGTAPGITHLILANNKLSGETPEGSLPHLRMALSKMPNSPVVMNNLAYALMKYEPDKLSEAQQLMEQALSIPGSSPVERASMLDTLGEIRLTQGETLAAIGVLEAGHRARRKQTGDPRQAGASLQ
jgi:hypothetical protein